MLLVLIVEGYRLERRLNHLTVNVADHKKKPRNKTYMRSDESDNTRIVCDDFATLKMKKRTLSPRYWYLCSYHAERVFY